MLFQFFNVRAHRKWIDQVIFHVQNHWKVDFRVIFLFSHHSFLLESFQVQNQHFGCFVYAQLLACLLMLFTCRAVPFVSLVQSLNFSQMVKTLIYRNCIVGVTFLRDRQCYCDKRIKSDWFTIAIWASDLGSILTSHQIDNNGLISFCVSDPAFEGDNVVRPSITVDRLNSWFFMDSV